MPHHAVFHSFFSGYRKQDADITAAMSKCIIETLKNRKVLFPGISNIWQNTDGFAEQYRCTTELYLLSMLSHTYNIIIDSGVVAPGYVRYVVDGLNATDKSFYKW